MRAGHPPDELALLRQAKRAASRRSDGRCRRAERAAWSSRRFVSFGLLFALAVLLAAAPAVAGEGSARAEIDFFTRTGCPHCAAAHAFLDELSGRTPGLTVHIHRVDLDAQAREQLRRLCEEQGIDVAGVPAFWVRGRLLVGFLGPDSTGKEIEQLIGAGPITTPRVSDSDECRIEGSETCAAPDTVIETRMFGPISSRRLGLPLFTIALGLLDGLNPCAIWVLLFLLSLLVHLKSRRRMALVAGTFVVVSGAAYLIFMAAWLSVFLFIGISRAVQVALGLAAALAGALHVKEFFTPGRGPSTSIPDSAKPGIYARTRAILRAESLPAALGAAAVLAVLVNAVELLCTAGLPAIYTQVLASHALPTWHYTGYLLLYVTAYMADDSLLVAVAVMGLGSGRLGERGGRMLQLASGALMLALAAALLFRPDVLG